MTKNPWGKKSSKIIAKNYSRYSMGLRKIKYLEINDELGKDWEIKKVKANCDGQYTSNILKIKFRRSYYNFTNFSSYERRTLIYPSKTIVCGYNVVCFFYLHFEDTSDFHTSTWWLEWHRPLWTPPTIPVEKEREQVIAPALEHNWVEKGTKKVPQRTTTLFVGS